MVWDRTNSRYSYFNYTDSTWGDLLTKYNDTTITYDTIGNPLIYRDGITMTWKNGRRLATFTRGDTSASFDYDADGLRTTKTVGTSRVDYYRAGGLLLGEVHTNGSESYTINYMYDESGRMLGFRLDGAEYYYVRDYSGDVTGLINARGELIGSYLYDPWGVLLETYLNTFEEETSEWTDADRAEYMRVLNLNPIRYKSYYYDTETGFYYLQSRYYDPITTRFINADGVVSGVGGDIRGYNMFVYCMNNPINMADDTGDFPFFLITAAIGAVVGAVVGGVVAAKTGKNVWAGIGIGAAAGALIGTGAGMAAGAALAGSITATTGAVMAGGSAFASTVATGGLGAGATYIANNLSKAVNNAAPALQAGATKMQQVTAKGKAGEVASGLVKNNQRIYITATKYRIPDGLDTTNKILSEVKNYSGTLSFTSQLRDFVSWSQTNEYQMHLYTNANLTGPLQRAVDSELIEVFPLK